MQLNIELYFGQLLLDSLGIVFAASDEYEGFLGFGRIAFLEEPPRTVFGSVSLMGSERQYLASQERCSAQ